MTPLEYKAKGFQLSSLIDQNIIDKAESDVIEAYINRINPTLPSTDEIYKNALMTLSFFLICKRTNVFATRSGSKEKKNEFSEKSTGWDNLQGLATDCHLALEKLKKTNGALSSFAIIDICGIYFKTNFFHI